MDEIKPVAVVGPVYGIHWFGTGPVAPIIQEHGIKVGDYLYPQQAIDSLRAEVERLAKLCNELGNDWVSEMEACKRAEAEAAALRADAGWIPCSVRVPDHYRHVETWPPYDDRTYNFYAHHDGGTNGVKAGNWYHNDREGYDWEFSPTHWRPKQPPPSDAAKQAAE